MALYYNLSKLIEQTNGNTVQLRAVVFRYTDVIERRLKKLNKATHKKKYEKVLKHTDRILPFLKDLELENALELNEALIEWAKKNGNRTEGDTIFLAYHECLEQTLKELKRDFNFL